MTLAVWMMYQQPAILRLQYYALYFAHTAALPTKKTLSVSCNYYSNVCRQWTNQTRTLCSVKVQDPIHLHDLSFSGPSHKITISLLKNLFKTPGCCILRKGMWNNLKLWSVSFFIPKRKYSLYKHAFHASHQCKTAQFTGLTYHVTSNGLKQLVYCSVFAYKPSIVFMISLSLHEE